MAGQDEGGTGTGRRERRRQETHERLFEAAMRLLSERDFDEVTVESITEAADVGKGTFFNYFASKEALISYRFEWQLERVDALMRQHFPDAPPDLKCSPIVGPIWPQIIMSTQVVAEIDGQSKKLMRNLLALVLTNPQVRLARQQIDAHVMEKIVSIVREGQAQGEFRHDIAAEVLAEHIKGIYGSVLLEWALSDSEDSLQEVALREFTLAWGGIRGDETP